MSCENFFTLFIIRPVEKKINTLPIIREAFLLIGYFQVAVGMLQLAGLEMPRTLQPSQKH